MTGQDNDTFESRLTQGVLEAIIDAGRTRDDGNSSVNMRKTLDALCGTVATFATTTIGRARSAPGIWGCLLVNGASLAWSTEDITAL
jgi:hypothetical protein